jgi:cytochrome c oxidase subunit 3
MADDAIAEDTRSGVTSEKKSTSMAMDLAIFAPTLRGWENFVADWSGDQEAFKRVHWGKAMMWIFLVSDTFIFGIFLTSYMTVRSSTTIPWPNTSEVFALTIGGQEIPLILIAIMTFILISSSGTMALAVNYGYRHDRTKTMLLMLATAAFGATFVSMQVFEWTIGVIYLTTIAIKVNRGDYERKGNYEVVEIAGLYWHFVDLVWVFIFAFFYLW